MVILQKYVLMKGCRSRNTFMRNGAVASSIALYHSGLSEENEIDLKTKGGILSVKFDEFNGSYKNIWLTGMVNLVYIGEFEC